VSAEIVILADWREKKVRCAVTFDPLAAWRAWFEFWAGVRK
jgi:hypothetical protein